MPNAAQLLPELISIVEEAGKRALSMQPGVARSIKPDGSIVTPADVAVEEALRPQLERLLPCGFQGEELGVSGDPQRGLWCIDPIDGTSNYAFGSPLWGTSVGLVQGDVPVLGVICLPGFGETYSASNGCGAFLNGERLPDIPPGKIRPEELVSMPDRILRMYPGAKFPGKMRQSGAFVVDAVFTISQRYRALLGLREKLYDIAAALCIAAEVGAEIRYTDGSPLLLEPLKKGGAKLEKAWMIFPQGTDFRLG